MRDFPPCNHRERVAGCFACGQWENNPAYKALWQSSPCNVVTIVPPPTEGPGTELADLLTELGMEADRSCACEFVKAWMNRLGPAGCRMNRYRIIEHLREAAEKVGKLAKVMAGIRALRSGLALRLNPLDPFPGLVDEAIRRASA